MSSITAVTSFGPAGYNQYGQRMIQSFIDFWPKTVNLRVLLDDTNVNQILSPHSNVTYHKLDNSSLLSFKERHKDNPEAHGLGKKSKGGKGNFAFDAVRFSHKVFALTQESRNENEYLLWLDGDTRTHAPVTEDRIKSWIPEGKFAGFLDRPWLYTETGFHIFNMGHLIARDFMERWEEYYLNDTVFELDGWTDCHTYDATRKQFNPAFWHNLSPNFEHPHPFINGPLGEVMDHMKGPRKDKGTSHAKDLKVKRDGYWKNVV